MVFDRNLATDFDPPAHYERSALAPLAQAHFLDLLQGLKGKAIVDLGKIQVFGRHPRHLEGARRGMGKSDLKEILAIGDIMRRIRMSAGDTRNVNWPRFQIARPFRRRHHHGRGAVGSPGSNRAEWYG